VALGAIANEGESVILEVFLHTVRKACMELGSLGQTKSFSRGQSSRSVAVSNAIRNRAYETLTVDCLSRAGKINGLDATSLLLNWPGQGRSGWRDGSWSAGESRDTCPARKELGGDFGL
jgi:hypothetical protein